MAGPSAFDPPYPPHPPWEELHEQILAEGPFVAHTSRFLIEARKPERSIAQENRQEK